MQKLTITRTNGNIPKSLAGLDHVSGLLVYMATGDIPEAFKTEPIQPVSTLERAEALGIVADAKAWAVKMLHYQLSELFRVGSGISLYLMIAPKGSTLTFEELGQLQRYAEGSIRQVGVWMGHTELTATLVAKLEAVAEALDGSNAPLSVLVAPKVGELTTLENLSGAAPRVSVVIGQDGAGEAADLYADAANQTEQNGAKASVSALGVVLALVAKASVHESIAWVRQNATGISLPAFGNGTLLRDVDPALLEALDGKRLLFFVTYPGIAGAYVNDSHTLDDATSDYAMIENVRTMDKAVRGIRTYLTPELGSSVYIDDLSGRLQPFTIKHLEIVANQALEDMEKAGELSGYRVEIDPEQDVLKTSSLEVVVKQVPVGVVRRIHVKIGFYKNLS